jgi:hypothetical protein
MFDRSVPQAENHTDERLGAWAASDVRRGDLVHKAKDQSFRFRKDLGLPNQVSLFRREQYSFVAIDPQLISCAAGVHVAVWHEAGIGPRCRGACEWM